MATSTVPGVKVTIVEKFYSSNEATTEAFAERALIVGRANEGVTDGWQAGTPTAYLYNPSIYGSENSVINDFGRGSDVHIAFNAATRAGARNIYISAVDPNPYAKDVADIPSAITDDYAGCTLEEYEIWRGLEHAARVAPSMILLAGFDANENIGGTRVSWAAKMLADRCEQLTEEVSPAFGVVGVTPLKEHYERANSATLTGVATTNTSGKSYQATNTAERNWIRGTVTAKDNGSAVDWADIETVDYSAGIVTFTSSYTVTGAVTVDAKQYGSFSDFYDAVTVAEYISGDETGPATLKGIATAAGTPTNTEEPFPVASVADAVDPTSSPTGLSKYLVLVAGDIIMVGQSASTSNSEYQNGAAATLGSIYATPLDEAITLRPMRNVLEPAFDLTKAQRLALIGKNVVPIALTPRGLIATIDGISFAADDSDGLTSVFSRLSSLRIAHEVTRGTRSVCEPFVGMQASTARLNSIETKLRGYYLALKQNGLAKEIKFEMSYSISTAKLTVYVSIIPYGEIREIDITVDVSLEA